MKKGFTLIELLGVIVVLGIIGLIIVPVVQGSIRNSSSKLCNDQVKMFEKSAKNYVAEHPYGDYGGANGVTISLTDLISGGYLENDSEGAIKNPKGGSFSGSVKITYESGKYNYEYIHGDDETNCED